MTSFGGGGDSRNANVTLSANVSPYSTQITQADQQTRGLSASIDGLSTKMAQLNRGAQGKLINFAKGDIAAMGVATTMAATFEKQLSTLRATAAVTGQDFNSMKRNIEGVFTSLPVSRTEVIQMAEALSQLGIKGGTSLGQLATTYEKLGAATGEFSLSLAQSMTQLNRLMTNAGPVGAAGFANTLLVLSKNAGVSAQAVADFSNSIAPMGRVLGLSEKQTLGLSTSFVKAGSDGFVAANLFNSMADEISQATQTGSPAILKYANLLGITADQFKKLPGADKITDLVDAIAKGGPAAQQFAQAMGLGPRQMASLTALAQSGDLAKNMQTAMGTSGTAQLEKASKAAFGGLSDQLVSFRNEMTQAGTAIGTTFLTPLTVAMRGVNALASGVGGLAGSFSGLIGSAMAVAAPVAGVGALALHAAGLIGTLALGRLMFRSTGAAAFSLGRAQYLGKSADQLTPAQQRAAKAQADQTMRPYQTRAVEAGRRSVALQERAFGPPGAAAPRAGELFRAAMIAPGRALTWAGNDTINMFNQAMKNDFDRRGLSWGQGGGFRQVMANLNESAKKGYGEIPRTYATTARTGVRYLQAAVSTGVRMGTNLVGAGLDKFSGPHPFEAARAAVADDAVARGMAGKSLTGFTATVSGATKEVGAFAKELIRGTAVAGARVGATTTGTVIGGAMRAGGAVLRAAFSPVGMVAMIGATYVASRVKKANEERTAIEESPYWMQPVKLYNDQLGLATKNLSSFNTGLADNTAVTRALGDVTEHTSMKVAGAFTPADVTAAGSKVADENLKTLKELGGSTKELTAYFLALGINDPRTLHLAGSQALAAGYNVNQVNVAGAAVARQSALGGLQGSPAMLAPAIGDATTRMGWYGNAMAGLTGAGGILHPGSSANKGFQAGIGIPGLQKVVSLFGWAAKETSSGEDKGALGLRGAGQSMIASRYDAAKETFNSAYAAQQKFIDDVHLIGGLLKQGGKGLDEAAKVAAHEWGGDETLWQNALIKAGTVVKETGVSLDQAVTNAVSTIPVGSFQVAALRQQGGTTDTSQWGSTLKTLKSGMTDAVVQNLTDIGPAGKFFATNPIVRAATTGPKSDQESVQFSAVQGGVDAMMRLTPATDRFGGGLDATTSKLLSLNGVLDRVLASGMDPSSRGFAVATASKTEAQQRLAEHVMTLPRAQQLQVAAVSLGQARTAAMAPGAPDSAKEEFAAQRQNWTQLEEGERQHLIAMIEMVKNYKKQQSRMEEDYNYQVGQANREFQIGMEHSTRDFHISQQHATEDFYLGQQRSQEEFNIQMNRSTQAQVRSAFDPFHRIQSQFTEDAGTVNQNIAEATHHMRTQLSQINELRQMGVSQDTIDFLRLADPANFQQTDSFYQTLKNAGSGLTGQINRNVGNATSAGTALIQNSMNIDYRQSVQDFSRRASQAVDDFSRHSRWSVESFNTQRADAVASHERQMEQLAHSFSTSMSRMQQDTADSLHEYTGSYQDLMHTFRGEISSAGGLLGKAGSQLSDQLGKELRTINGMVRQAEAQATKLQELTYGNIPGTIGNPFTAPDTIGINPKGDVGYYTMTGQWVPTPNAKLPPGPDHIAPPGPRPLTMPGAYARPSGRVGHAAGGISTSAHTASISEGNHPEAIIPLDGRGQNFLTEMYRNVSRSLVQQLQSTGRGVSGTGTAATTVNNTYDHSTSVSGVTVVASSPDEMLKALQQKQRLSRLTSPHR